MLGFLYLMIWRTAKINVPNKTRVSSSICDNDTSNCVRCRSTLEKVLSEKYANGVGSPRPFNQLFLENLPRYP